MASVTIPLNTAVVTPSGTLLNFTDAAVGDTSIPAALMAGSNADRLDHLILRASSNDNGSNGPDTGTAANREISDAWKTNTHAVTITIGDYTITINGPGSSDREPYAWNASDISAWRIWFAAVAGLSNFRSQSASITLRDTTLTESTQYLYQEAATAPNLPSGNTQRFMAGATGWTDTDPGLTSALNVYRISRTVFADGSTFQGATSDWAWDPTSQPGAPWRAANPATRTEYAYIRPSAAPTLPTPANQRATAGVPSGWSATELSPTTSNSVYRISRTITELLGVFQSASSDWAWDPGTQPGAPWMEPVTSVTIALNLASVAISANRIDIPDSAIADTEIPPSLVVGGTATRLSRLLLNSQAIDFGGGSFFYSGAFQLDTHSGADLVSAWETNVDGITITIGSETITTGGPGTASSPDTSEPYSWQPLAIQEWHEWMVAVADQSPAPQTGSITLRTTRLASGRISNKISELPEETSHTFTSAGIAPADGAVTWAITAGRGEITNAGVYTAPDVTANEQVTVALRVNGVEVDTVTFTVQFVAGPTISNKIATLTEEETHDFDIADTRGTMTWAVSTGPGSIATDGTYSLSAAEKRALFVDTTVVVQLLEDGAEADTDTFDVTPVITGSITNKIGSTGIAETGSHTYTYTTSDGDRASVTFGATAGTITNAGVFTPPDVSIDTTVTVSMNVRGASQDSDTFTVSPVFTPVQSTQYAYLRADSAPTLPAPSGQRSAAGVPSGWGSTALTANTTNHVYRISRTITTLQSVFQQAESDWAWDPTSQPGTPWRQATTTTATQYIHRRISTLNAAPDLPAGTDEAVPNGWQVAAFNATLRESVYRASRTVTSRLGNFVSATAWAWDPNTQPDAPWRASTGYRETQYAYIQQNTAPALPAPAGQRSTGTAPTGWSTTAPATSTTAHTYRISRLIWRLRSNDSFSTADADWAWDPNTQPGVPWDEAGVTTVTQYAYLRAAAEPTLPTTTTEALPTGWVAANPGPTSTLNVYRIVRTVTSRLGTFIRATAWAFDPAAQPFQSLTTSTQYAYLRQAAAPDLPAPSNQRTTAGIPSGWQAAAPSTTTTAGVWRISRTITEIGSTFQQATSDWAWDPNTQPGVAWRLPRTTTRTQYAYLVAATEPGLPSDRVERLPTGWTAANPGATTEGNVYRIRRTVTERLSAFVSATAWVFDPSSQPFAQATTTTRAQFAFRLAETLTAGDLPSSTAEALPNNWVAMAPESTRAAGVYRISRTVTERLGTFVSATAWAWEPAYTDQPYIQMASDVSQRLTTQIRHKTSGVTASIIWAIQADLAHGADGEEGIGVEYIFTSSVDATAVSAAADLPDPNWNYDNSALANGVTRGDYTYYDGTPGDLTDDRPYMIRFRRPIPGSPAQDEDVGEIAWTQDPAIRVHGQAGIDGEEGVGVEYIFTAKATLDPITGDANLPLSTWNYDAAGLATGITRGTQTYYDGNPTDLTETKPYRIRFRRAVSGSPAADSDIGDVNWVQERGVLAVGQAGTDGEEGVGVEYIFTSKANATAITGDANLPVATWNYDAPELASGRTRGTQTYYDGDPSDITADKPFRIRFRRPVSGSPAADADIGSVAWTQEAALRVFGEEGTDGTDGQGVEYIFTSKANGNAITGNANLPVGTWFYDATGLASGITRGNQTYYDGTPSDISATRPFRIRFRRPVPGSPAANTDIGDVSWTQEAAVQVFGEEGSDGEEGVGVEYIFTAKANSTAITGSANLPVSTWVYDDTRLANGLTRGNQTYYDGTPANVTEARPFVIRFRRSVPGSPTQGDDIGDVAWTQDAAVRQRGERGSAGTGGERIFTSKANSDAITGDENLPLASWLFSDSRLNDGETRGDQVYYSGTPADLSETKPYMITFRRPITGSPAIDDDIGSIDWTQEPAVLIVGAPVIYESSNRDPLIIWQTDDGGATWEPSATTQTTNVIFGRRTPGGRTAQTARVTLRGTRTNQDINVVAVKAITNTDTTTVSIVGNDSNNVRATVVHDTSGEEETMNFRTIVSGSSGAAATFDVQIEDNTLTVVEGSTVNLRARLRRLTGSGAPSASTTITATESDTDITITNPSNGQRTFTTTNWNSYQTWTIRGDTDTGAITNETAALTLTASGAVTDTATATITILDDDVLDIEDTSIDVAPGSTATFRVRLEGQPSGDVTVDLSSNHNDVTTSADLTFTRANWNTYQTVTVTAASDATGSATISVDAMVSAGGGTHEVESGSVSVDIDPPDIDVDDSTVTVNEGQTTTFRARLDRRPASSVTITASESDSDITITSPNNRQRTFTTTNWNTYQSWTVRGDTDADSQQDTGTVTLTASGGSTDTATVTVTVTEGVAIQVDDRTITVVEGNTNTFRARLTGRPMTSVTITATESDSDITITNPSNGQRVFSTANWNTYQTWTVRGDQDADTGNDSATITLTASGGSSDTETVSVTITDDDVGTATFNIEVDDDTITVTEGSTTTFRARLTRASGSGNPSASTTITATESDSDITITSPSNGQRTFSTTNWNTYQSWTVRGDQDADTQNDSATISLAASGGSTDTDSVSVTITDDDSAATFAIEIEDDSITVDEGSTATFRARLTRTAGSGNPSGTTTITASESSSKISISSTAALTFSTSNWDDYQSWTVSGTQDSDSDDETATVTLTATGAVSDTDTVSVTVDDDDTPVADPAIGNITGFSVTRSFGTVFGTSFDVLSTEFNRPALNGATFSLYRVQYRGGSSGTVHDTTSTAYGGSSTVTVGADISGDNIPTFNTTLQARVRAEATVAARHSAWTAWTNATSV